MLDCLPTTNSQRKMLSRNMPWKKLRIWTLLLNAVGDLAEDDPVDCGYLGEALQLELAALAAFGKGSGKGKNKGKGKPKGKPVRSNLTLEQRRAKLAETKSKSKCLRCGGTGHWAGDPVSRYPNCKGKTTKPASQSQTAMVAYMSAISDSADDGACTVLTFGRGETPTALMGYSVAVGRAKAKAKAKPTSAPAVAPKGGASSSPRRPAYQGPVSEHPLPNPKSKSVAKKKPPNPPLDQKCAVCTDFVRQGSTAYTIKKTCRD